MKKNILILVAGLVSMLFFAGCGDKMNNDGESRIVNGGVSTNALLTPSYYYELDTWGTDADVFEFVPSYNPNVAIINVGGGKSRGIDIIPRLSKEENAPFLKKRINNTKDNNPVYPVDAYYEIDTWLSNADIFEFTPRSNYKYTCVSVGDNHSLKCRLKPEFMVVENKPIKTK